MPSPTISRVKDAMKQLQNNKVAGKDSIGADLGFRTSIGGKEGRSDIPNILKGQGLP